MNILEAHLREVVDKTWNANRRCKTWDDHVWNAVSGLAAEAGEVLDIHKKMWFHGDVLYYVAKLIELHGFTPEELLEANKAKLFDRYDVKG